jgi:hypothetical protein
MNRNQYIEHLRTVALGLHLEGMQKWADLIVDNLYWVKEKTLTDEEILDVERRLRNNGDFCELHFARAILRKAQNEVR